MSADRLSLPGGCFLTAYAFSFRQADADLSPHEGARTIIVPSHLWGGIVVSLSSLVVAAAIWVFRPDLQIVATALVLLVLSAPYTLYKRERLGDADVIFFSAGGKALVHGIRGEGDIWFLRGMPHEIISVGFQALQVKADEFETFSCDGLKLRLDVSVAYMVAPEISGNLHDPVIVRQLWKMKSNDFVKTMMATPQAKMALREVIGRHSAFATMTTDREAIRKLIMARIGELYANSRLKVVGVGLGEVRLDPGFYEHFVDAMAHLWANRLVGPSLSPQILEQGRFRALEKAAVIYVPTGLPHQTLTAEASPTTASPTTASPTTMPTT